MKPPELWMGGRRGLTRHSYGKSAMCFWTDHSKRKPVGKLFFACLKPWSSKNLPFQLHIGIHGKFKPDIFPEGIYKTFAAVVTFKDSRAKGKSRKCRYTWQILLIECVCVQNLAWVCFSYGA